MDGSVRECDCGDLTPNRNGVCDDCKRIDEKALEELKTLVEAP